LRWQNFYDLVIPEATINNMFKTVDNKTRAWFLSNRCFCTRHDSIDHSEAAKIDILKKQSSATKSNESKKRSRHSTQVSRKRTRLPARLRETDYAKLLQGIKYLEVVLTLDLNLSPSCYYNFVDTLHTFFQTRINPGHLYCVLHHQRQQQNQSPRSE